MKPLPLIVAVLSTFLLVSAAAAQPLTFVAPTTPGGGIDTYARMLAQEFTRLGQPAIVENRAGGGTIVGTEYVVRSEPNGRTVLLTVNTLSIDAAVSKSLPFDPIRDLAPVAYLGSEPFVIGVNTDVPANTLVELIALLKQPNQISYASCGQLTAQHLAGELLKWKIAGNMVHVPYRGCAPAIADVAGGHVEVGISPVTTTLPFIDSGKIRPLAVTSPKRSPLLPNVPTAQEAGLKDYLADQWYGLFVAAATPTSIVDKLNAEVVKIVHEPDVVKTLKTLDIDPAASSPDEFKTMFREDVNRWTKLAKAIGLQPD